jgi:hypothetical protein
VAEERVTSLLTCEADAIGQALAGASKLMEAAPSCELLGFLERAADPAAGTPGTTRYQKSA